VTNPSGLCTLGMRANAQTTLHCVGADFSFSLQGKGRPPSPVLLSLGSFTLQSSFFPLLSFLSSSSSPFPFLSSPLPSPLFRSKPPKYSYGVSGSAVSSPSGVWAKLQPTNDLGSKRAALVAAVFVDFPKNKCNFLHKNKPDIVRWVKFLTQGGAL